MAKLNSIAPDLNTTGNHILVVWLDYEEKWSMR